MASQDDQGPEVPFQDAEAWLERRGVRRDPLPVGLTLSNVTGAEADAPGDRTPVSVREAVRLAREAPTRPDADEAERTDQTLDGSQPGPLPDLGEQVTAALAYIRRATATTPMFEGRIRERLQGRGVLAVVIDLALERARAERLIDDIVFARALIQERLEKGHAPTRIERDLITRGLANDVAAREVAAAEPTDLEAAAFDVAQRRAVKVGHLEAEAAFRRVLGYLSRRGYPEGMARRVARQAIFVDREDERIAGR